MKYAGVHICCGFMYLERSRPRFCMYQKQPCEAVNKQQGRLTNMAPELLN
jgi:hypothetical protein